MQQESRRGECGTVTVFTAFTQSFLYLKKWAHSGLSQIPSPYKAITLLCFNRLGSDKSNLCLLDRMGEGKCCYWSGLGFFSHFEQEENPNCGCVALGRTSSPQVSQARQSLANTLPGSRRPLRKVLTRGTASTSTWASSPQGNCNRASFKT